MITEITNVIDSYNLSSNTPGFAFVVARSNTVIHEHFTGQSNPTHSLITADSKFRIASITKQFTAAAILQLIEAGKLELSTPITTILVKLGPYADGVTIKHMLTHTSGLPDYEDIANEASPDSFTDEDVYQVLCNVSTLDFEPGSAYHYSNTAYCLLAVAVRILSGLSFKDYLETNIFPPAGMTDASVGAPSGTNRVYGFSPGGDGWVLHDQSKFTTTQGDGGIYASVNDLVQWQQNLYQNKTIITPRSLELMCQPYVQTNYAAESYGFGIALTTVAGETCFLHHGTSSGFENALFYLPELDISMVILANFSGTDLNTITLGKQIITNHLAELKAAA